MKWVYVKVLALVGLVFWCSSEECTATALDSAQTIQRIMEAQDLAKKDPKKAAELFAELKEATQKGKADFLYGKAVSAEGHSFFSQAKYELAINNFLAAAEIFERIGNTDEIVRSYSRIGVVWQYLNDYQKSLNYLFNALRLEDKVTDRTLISAVYNNIGIAYETLEDWENTIKYGMKSIGIKQEMKDTAGLARTYNNLANAYYYQKNFEQAIEYIRLSNQYYRIAQDSQKVASSLSDLGNMFAELGQLDSALHYLTIAEQYLSRNVEELLYSYCINLIGLGNTLVQARQMKKAKKYFDACKVCEEEIDDFAFLRDLYKFKYHYLKMIGDYKSSLVYSEKMFAAYESIFKQSKVFENQRIAIRYDFEQKATEDSLNYQLSLSEKERDAAQYKSRMYFFVVLALLAAILAGVFFAYNYINSKRRLIADQRRELAEAKALRAQMNPHFIFNCLNTIDSFVLQDRTQDASRLIQRFSKLTRRILEHSTHEYITLAEELSTLEIYLNIEQLRKSRSFTYQIQTDRDLAEALIPPLLLQPFVENAVIHGMKGKTDGHILIDVNEQRGQVVISIDDNGIGRQKAMDIKSSEVNTHRSFGMEVTLQRLEVLHGHSNHEAILQFYDKTAPETGTRVEITIPLKNQNHVESNFIG